MLTDLQKLEIGGGRVGMQSGAAHLELPGRAHGYADAQLDDYASLARDDFPWRPPLAFHVRARANVRAPQGTLGFGFWNDPFAISLGGGGAARRIPAAPQAAWFFYGSPPNELSFGSLSPGQGWLAMSMRSKRIPSPLLAVPAAAAFALTRLRVTRRLLFSLMRTTFSFESAVIDVDLTAWHSYRIDWRAKGVEFRVDGERALRSSFSPHPPLGLVLWIDNQYLCASPSAGLRFGVLPTAGAQRLELQDLSIERPQQIVRPVNPGGVA